jgi:hypothetical protein
MGQSARSAPWLPTMDSPAPVTHAAKLVIAARTILIVNITRAVIPCVVMEGTVEDITLIVAKEIIMLTIVKVTEVRAQEVRTKEARAKVVMATKKTSMDVAIKEVTSIVSDSQMMATTRRHARAAPAIGYHHRDQFNHRNSLSDDDQFDRADSAIVAARHVGNKLHSQTVVADSGATRHMFYDLSVSTDSSLSQPRLSSWATTRQSTVLRLVRLCSTCLTGVVSAFLKSFKCPASPSTS